MIGTVYDDLWPDPMQKRKQVAHSHIANAQLNHAGWRFCQHDPIRKVGIFTDDGKVMLLRILPDGCIRQIITNIKNVGVIFSLLQRETVRQVRIDQELSHQATIAMS